MTFAVFLAACASLVAVGSIPKGVAVSYQAIVPEGDLTAITRPLDSALLAFPDARGAHPIQFHRFHYDNGTDELFVIQGMVASRRVRMEGFSRDSLAAVQRSWQDQILQEMGTRVESSLDTLYDPVKVRWTRHETWRWSSPRGTVKMEVFQPVHDTSENGILFARLDSVVRTAPGDTAISNGAWRLKGFFRDTSDSSGEIRVSSWNRLERNAFGDALSACLRTHRCDRFPGLERDSVGAPSLTVALDSIGDHWLPQVGDTHSRETDYSDESISLQMKEYIQTGVLDSFCEFETRRRRLDEREWAGLRDSILGWSAQRRDDFFRKLDGSLDPNLSPSAVEKLADLGSIVWKRVLPSIRRTWLERFVMEIQSNRMLVSIRPVAVPWPLEDRDVTQRYRPTPRPPTPTPDDLPEKKPIAMMWLRYKPYAEIVHFVGGKVQQRRIFLNWDKFSGPKARETVDSAYRVELEELRGVFGQELETRRDTAGMPRLDGNPFVFESRIWRPEGGEVKIRRFTEYMDTLEGHAMLDRALRKLSEADPSLDSARLHEMSSGFRTNILGAGKASIHYEVILSNPMEPDRFLQAMGRCLEDSTCDPDVDQGVGRNSEGDMVADSYKIPDIWFPERGALERSIKPISDSTFPLQNRVETLRGFAGDRWEFQRTSRSLIAPPPQEFSAVIVAKIKAETQKTEGAAQERPPLQSFLVEESGVFLSRMILAMARRETLSQDLTVKRRETKGKGARRKEP